MSTSPLLGSRSSSVSSSPRTSRDLEKASLPHPLPLANPPSTRPSRLVLRRALCALAAVGLVLLGLSRLQIDVNVYSINIFPPARRVITTPPVPQVVVRESAPRSVSVAVEPRRVAPSLTGFVPLLAPGSRTASSKASSMRPRLLEPVSTISSSATLCCFSTRGRPAASPFSATSSPRQTPTSRRTGRSLHISPLCVPRAVVACPCSPELTSSSPSRAYRRLSLTSRPSPLRRARR
jgi:hypothetical protein